ncbi:MAG: hypothetical protein KJN71_02985 [Acidimicrobiia bacterium]|nr:hypothetical protein [Acidimicrobiia bacterium]
MTLNEVEAGLPELPFLLHVDQVRALLDLNEKEFMSIAFRRGIDYGDPPSRLLCLMNIAPTDQDPMWRVDYKELRRWCRRNQIPTYQW